MTPAACPSRAVLSALLEGNGGEPKSPEIRRHLEECPRCQQTLQQLAADPHTWAEVRAALCDAGQVTTRVLDAAISTLKQRGGSPQLPVAFDVSFLDPPAAPDEIGRLKQYRVLQLIGRGGFGIVFKALDEPLNRVVALKVLGPSHAASAEARQRFLREAQAAAAVTQENIVAIHAVDEFRGMPYLVMQFIAGMSLQERLEQHGPLAVEEAVRIAMQTAEGLAAAHRRGLVHRDVKPANILLPSGAEPAKLTDFGLARAVDDVKLTQTGIIAGTPQFMSPEQASGKPRVDHRADLFSLGSVLYAMATGHAPFAADSVHGVLHQVIEEEPPSIRIRRPELPAWLDDLIARLHAKDPRDRFASAAEVAELLRQHLAHLEGRAPRPTPVRRLRRFRPWGTTAAVIAAGLFGMAVTTLGAVGLIWLNQPPVPQQPAAAPEKKGDDWLPPPEKKEPWDWDRPPPEFKGPPHKGGWKEGWPPPDHKGPPEHKGPAEHKGKWDRPPPPPPPPEKKGRPGPE